MDEHNKFSIWLEIEVLACEAQAKSRRDPAGSSQHNSGESIVNIDRIAEIEAEVKHDVIAFLTSVGEFGRSRFALYSSRMTSSDVLDTSLAVQMKQSGELLLHDLEELRDVLARRAKEFKMTVMIGRSHGVHAEPTTFGLKLALWFDESRRNIVRLKNAIRYHFCRTGIRCSRHI